MKITIPGIHTRVKKRKVMITPGSVRRGGFTISVSLEALFLLGFSMLMGFGAAAYASVERVDGGIQFTYYDPDAGEASIAGSFNGWNSSANPMTRDDEGYWRVTLQLGSGEHSYKFVVDGAWITDMDNPVTKSDGYGGNNSVVEIDNKGDVITQAAASPLSNTLLSSKIFIGGRYLNRTNVESEVAGDPRWRLQRPSNEIDFNFRITINDLVHGYTRMRINSGEKILQPNNIDTYLDEAHIEIKPDAFTILGYYNEEVLRSNDPFGVIGDFDLPGTIFDDHLKEGKGTSGLTASTSQFGVDFAGLLANLHDYNYYNNPNLYDNTGTDVAHARASKTMWNVTGGANVFFTRNLWWLDFTSVVGQAPANTGIGKMDEFLDATGDASDWFEFEDKAIDYGLDLSLDLYDGKLLPTLEYLWGEINQGFVTGNNSGLNFETGPIDVPILKRDKRLAHGGLECKLIENVYIKAEHTRSETVHSSAGEGILVPVFFEDVLANKQLFFVSSSDPPTSESDYSELELRWHHNKVSAVLWFQRTMTRYRYPVSQTRYYIYNFSVSPGITVRPIPKLELELESQYTDHDHGALNPFILEGTSIEAIVRGSYKLPKNLSAIFDVRHLYIDDDNTKKTDSYTAPYGGLQYDPTKKVSIVLAYGVDPLEFGIDYEGRHIGRYMFRQQYIWENPGASWMAAEEALADKRMVSLRAIYNF
ncbi:MAG: glycogen-binding domain-containing protein [Candidatus Latescibacterota bacterium]